MKIGLFGYLREYLSADHLDFAVRDGMTVADIVAELHINPLLVAVVLANGQRVSLDYSVKPSDELVLMAPLSGGSNANAR
jgi:sulfur carrier protein ThiS